MTSRLPIRLRVAIAFSITTALAVAGLGAFVYYRVEATLLDQTGIALRTQLDALARLPARERANAVSELTGETFAQVFLPDGDLEVTSPQVGGALVGSDRFPREPGVEVTAEQQAQLRGEGEQETVLISLRRLDGQVLLVGTALDDVDDALDKVLTQLLVGGPLALALASTLGYVVAGSALRSIERMRQRAAAISADSSKDRLPLPAARDELHRLGRTLNAMLDRLDDGLDRERRFVAEASHELRTPLALLRMELDLALSRPRDADELRAALRSASEEVDRLTRLSEQLLALASTGAGAAPGDEPGLDVGDLLEAVAARFATVAGRRERSVSVSCDGSLRARADRAKIDQVLSNLVDNALRHGSGDVRLSARCECGRVVLRVRDGGAGLDADVAERAFDHFSRGPGDRSGDGHGLGLAIVRAVVDEHRGHVRIEDGGARTGTTVVIELPADERP